MALGARVADVIRLFVGQNLRLAAIGVAIGLVVSAIAARVLTSFLFGLAPTDLATFAAGGVVLTIVAAVASYLPARHAARVQPGQTLRQ
jgi:ABC-type lipoprotein release transport system permease subunit